MFGAQANAAPSKAFRAGPRAGFLAAHPATHPTKAAEAGKEKIAAENADRKKGKVLKMKPNEKQEEAHVKAKANDPAKQKKETAVKNSLADQAKERKQRGKEGGNRRDLVGEAPGDRSRVPNAGRAIGRKWLYPLLRNRGQLLQVLLIALPMRRKAPPIAFLFLLPTSDAPPTPTPMSLLMGMPTYSLALYPLLCNGDRSHQFLSNKKGY